MAPSSLPHFLFLLALTTSSVVVAAAAAAAGGDGDHGLKHIRLYVRETSETSIAVLQSPLGANNASFGSIAAVDDEIRVGPDPSSQLVGRYQGLMFGTSVELGKGYLSSITLVFTAGEYGGSTLSVHGPVLGFTGTVERAVIGGTGVFRLARGYMLFKMINSDDMLTSEEVGFISEMNLFVLMQPAGPTKENEPASSVGAAIMA